MTSNCTAEMLDRHRLVGALEIRRLMLEHGVEEGWRRAEILFGQPVQAVVVLDRDLTDDERGLLESDLGIVCDHRGYLVGGPGLDHIQLGEGEQSNTSPRRRGSGGQE